MTGSIISTLLSPENFDELTHQEAGKLWWEDHASIVTYIQGNRQPKACGRFRSNIATSRNDFPAGSATSSPTAPFSRRGNI